MEQGGLSVCNVHLNTSLREEGRGVQSVKLLHPTILIDQVKAIWVIFTSSDYLASNSFYLQCTYVDALAKG